MTFLANDNIYVSLNKFNDANVAKKAFAPEIDNYKIELDKLKSSTDIVAKYADSVISLNKDI